MSSTVKILIKTLSLTLVLIMVFSLFHNGYNLSESLAEEEFSNNSIVLFVGSPIALVNDNETQVDSNQILIVPTIENSRTLVPIRFISENLNAVVNWDGNSQTITITQGKNTIKMVIGNTTYQLNGESRTMDTAPKISNDRTLVPIRVISESFGKKVFYDRGLIIISDIENIFNPSTDKGKIDKLIAKVNVLPTVGTTENLIKILALNNNNYGYNKGAPGMALEENANSGSSASGGGAGGGTSKSDGAAPPSNAADTPQAPLATGAPQANNDTPKDDNSSSPDYSNTNVQVQGVDEADIVKTDGQYIYYYSAKNNKVFISLAYPVNDMKLVSTIDIGNNGIQGSEMYLTDNKLILICQSNYYSILPAVVDTGIIAPPSTQVPEGFSGGAPAPNRAFQNAVSVLIYDISNKEDVKKIRQLDLDGNVLTTRKIGSTLYLLSNKYIYYYGTLPKEDAVPYPTYKDSTASSDAINIPMDSIRYFPGTRENSYLSIMTVDLDDMSKESKVDSYVGAGSNVYVSNGHIYVAVTQYNQESQQTVSDMHKFSIDGQNITYIGKGQVPGTLLNQFSMDEYNGYFRLAVTKDGNYKNNYQSLNDVYVLDDSMHIVGKIEDIAPGERIYSVRFTGDRGYVVTFRQIDPLFVIDFKEPSNPHILGKLKIPGYSTYMHPYDENHIIGFGMDVDANTNRTIGFKMALFDITDVTNPTELYKENIGNQFSTSELLTNHKALLFSKEKELLAFPVTVNDTDEAFQGAYVYNINLTDGFKLRGKITHLTEEDFLKMGDYYYPGYYDPIERILYISNALYTVSGLKLMANDINTIEFIKSVDFK